MAEIINSNIYGERSTAYNVTGVGIISLYVYELSGKHEHCHIGLEYSPDGVVWVEGDETLEGAGILTTQHAAVKVRAVVVGSSSLPATANIHIITK